MRDAQLRSRISLPLVALLLLGGSLMPTHMATHLDRLCRVPRGLLLAATTPLTHPLAYLASRVHHEPATHVDLGDPDEVNLRYLHLLRWARYLERELTEARQQVAQLSQVRQRGTAAQVQLLSASVTAIDSRRSNRTLTLNRGIQDGLEVGLVVADGFNLVGRVVNVSSVNATVQMITAPQAQPFVRIVPPLPGQQREAYAQLRPLPEGEGFEVKLGIDSGVLVGDLAHLADDAWPREASGFVVGKVTAVNEWPSDPLLYRSVRIAPLAPLERLTRVVVLVPVAEGSAAGGIGP